MENIGRKLNTTLGSLKSKYGRSAAIPQSGSSQQEDADSICSTPPKMEGNAILPLGRGHSRSASGTSATSLAGAGASRSISMNSISSDGSSESPLMEQEDINVLTHNVRSFKEALGRVRRIFHPERECQETLRVVAHERLGEVLRILRGIIEKYPPIQSTELLMAAGTLIQQVRDHNFEDEKADATEFYEAVDQLALAFSSRVSEYLMGDLDASSQPVPKTRSCDNLLAADGESDPYIKDKGFASATLTPEEIDMRLKKLGDGVDQALRRAKVWSKYAKDVITYIEKRANLEAEHARNLIKLANATRQVLKKECFLPFQSVYCAALDQDVENANIILATCILLQGHKFIEPLSARRNEHEKTRKDIKELWQKELKKRHDAVNSLHKAKALYNQRHYEYVKAKESACKAGENEGTDVNKAEKKKRLEDDAFHKADEAKNLYKACVTEANERNNSLDKVKEEVLKRVRELIYQCDQTMKAVTVGYFQLQHTISAPAPVQFQTMCENSRLYEPGTQYMEFVKRLPDPSPGSNDAQPFIFEPCDKEYGVDKDRRSGSNGSYEDELHRQYIESRLHADGKERFRGLSNKSGKSAIPGSDSDSIGSYHSNKSRDESPAASPFIPSHKDLMISSGDELDVDHDQDGSCILARRQKTVEFSKYESFAIYPGLEYAEFGGQKKCSESHGFQYEQRHAKRKMTTFGVDLTSHTKETGESVPPILSKCIAEIERVGLHGKGIYRVSGVKSKVEKLCQSFENGADSLDLTDVNPNVVANVLKLYIRQLPEPLLTYRLYPDFIKVAKDYPGRKDEGPLPDGAIADLKKLVKNLPPVHCSTLAYLMHHLHRVSKLAHINNMPPSNLGIVFGPTLLRPSEGSASLTSLVDTVYQTRVIELLITYAHEIFGPSPYPLSTLLEDENSNVEKIESKTGYSRKQGQKILLGQSTSSVSQVSDIDYLQNFDGGEDLDDTSLPGCLPINRSRGSDMSHQGSDVTHSSDDWLESGNVSEEENSECNLPDDSVFKISPLPPYSNLEQKSQHQQTVMKLHESQASLMASLARSGASHSSCHIRVTDDGVLQSTDTPPIPPPRKNASNTVPINQSFLHGSEKTCELSSSSSISESSGVSSAASTSPTTETSQISSLPCAEQSNAYTSTAIVTLAGQQLYTSALGARTSSSMTAELRRQFFETTPVSTESTSLTRSISSSSSQSDPCTSVAKTASETYSSVPISCFTSVSPSPLSRPPTFGGNEEETVISSSASESLLESTGTKYVGSSKFRTWWPVPGENSSSLTLCSLKEDVTEKKSNFGRVDIAEMDTKDDSFVKHHLRSTSLPGHMLHTDEPVLQPPASQKKSQMAISSLSYKKSTVSEQNASSQQTHAMSQTSYPDSSENRTSSSHQSEMSVSRQIQQTRGILSCPPTVGASESYSQNITSLHSSSLNTLEDTGTLSHEISLPDSLQILDRTAQSSEKLSPNRQPRFV